MAYPFIITDTSVTVFAGRPLVADHSHPNFDKIRKALQTANYNGIEELFDVAQAIETWAMGNISVAGDTLAYKGRPIHNTLTDRILRMRVEGFDVRPMVNFLENLMQNPSANSVNQLYTFLEANNNPITPDGHFLAYKRIRENWKDVYTGTIDNSVGQVVTMERNQVNDDPQQTCSFGLHVCAWDYLSGYSGERIIVVKVNPRDVVSVPTDYHNTKMRVSRYEVIAEDPDAITREGWTSIVDTQYSEIEEDEDEDDYAPIDHPLDITRPLRTRNGDEIVRVWRNKDADADDCSALKAILANEDGDAETVDYYIDGLYYGNPNNPHMHDLLYAD